MLGIGGIWYRLRFGGIWSLFEVLVCLLCGVGRVGGIGIWSLGSLLGFLDWFLVFLEGFLIGFGFESRLGRWGWSVWSRSLGRGLEGKSVGVILRALELGLLGILGCLGILCSFCSVFFCRFRSRLCCRWSVLAVDHLR